MRPQIPDRLEEQVEAVAEQAGYSSGSELVRDAVRRRVDELEEYPSDRAIRRWLNNENRLDVVSKDTFPGFKFDEGTGETTTIEDATWTILLRTANVPIWVHGQRQSAPISITCPVLRSLFSEVDESILLEGPGYLVGLSRDNRPVDTISQADGIKLAKRISRRNLDKGELLNTILGMAATVEMAVSGTPPFEKMVTGWDKR